MLDLEFVKPETKEIKPELKLDKELKAKWIEALRSGKYSQAPDVLYKETVDGVHAMCCLGVFEHICGTSLEGFHIETNDQMPESLEERKTPADVMTQQIVLPALKIEGNWYKGTIEGYLAAMNDGGKSFEEIAQFIDENL